MFTFNIQEADLEHIRSKSQYDKSNPEQNRLGNCTLLETRNTFKHKGNRSIQDSSFQDKLKSYKDSNIKITRDIYDDFQTYSVFDNHCISEREAKLCKELFDITEKHLNPNIKT